LTKYYLERNFGLGTTKLILGYVVEIIRKQFLWEELQIGCCI